MAVTPVPPTGRESRDPAGRERELLARLPGFIAHAKASSAAYARKLEGIDPAGITGREALAQLPPTRKHELVSEQERLPPFGGHDSFDSGAPIRLFMSPGPIAECEFSGPNYWRTAEVFRAAGFQEGMTVHNSFAYHFTPAGFMCEAGAHELGCRVFPAGTGNSEQQARAIARLRCDAYTGTPDFLGTILEKADAAGIDVNSLGIASVTGGYLSPEARAGHLRRGIRTLQWYGTADVGAIAYEPEADAPMVVVEDLLVEVVDPLTARPLPAGEKGEVLVTNLNRSYPLIRLALGDLTKVVEGPSPCGRTNMRIAGWLGRCGEAAKVKGMFVHPAQVARVIGRVAGLAAARLVVTRDDSGTDKATLVCVLARPGDDTRQAETPISEAFAAETGLRCEVTFAEKLDDTGNGLIADNRKGP